MGRNVLDIDAVYAARGSNMLLESDYDVRMFDALYRMIRDNRFTYITVLKSAKYAELREWVVFKTPLLDDPGFEYTDGTRLVWVLSGMADFPKCRNPSCGRRFGERKNVTFNRCYGEHCCNRCLGSDPVTVEKKSLTCMKNYGVSHPMKCAAIRDRALAPAREHGFGSAPRAQWTQEIAEKARQTRARHIAEDPDFNRKIAEKARATKLAHGRPANWNNREAAAKTYRERTGYDWPMQNPAVRAAAGKSYMDRHGYENPLSSPELRAKGLATKRANGTDPKTVASSEEFKEKVKSTCEARYGARNVLCLPDVRERIAKTNVARYGAEYPSRAEQVKDRAKATRLARYGVSCVPSGRYLYEGQRFDSAAELAFWVWARDSGRTIRRCCEEDRMEFSSDGDILGYYPDFEVDGGLVEIKGDQFFRPDGTMFLPYRKKSWTDEQYERMCRRYEAKRQCMLANGVKLLKYSSDEVQAALEYVGKAYGEDWLPSLRMSA